MFRILHTSLIFIVAGLSAAITNDANAQTVGSRASTVDTSGGSADFITSSSPLPNGGVIMSSQYPSGQYDGGVYVAEAPMGGYDYGQAYGYDQYGYADSNGYVQQPTYAQQQAAYPQAYQYPQVYNNQSAPVYGQQPNQYQQTYQQQQLLNANSQASNQAYQHQPPTSLVSYQTQAAPATNQNQAANVNYQYQGYSTPAYQQTSYQQPTNPNQWQASNGSTQVAQLNTQAQNPGGLQWQPVGNATYTAQAPNCCNSQPPANPYAYPPPPANPQYAPTAPTYAPYGATAGYPNRAQWKPLIPLRALPPGVYVGQGIVGQPVAYVDKEPVRNFLRYISF